MSASSGSTEEVVHLTYGDRTLTDGRGHTLHRAAAHVPDREDARTVGLEHSRAGPPCRAGAHKPFSSREICPWSRVVCGVDPMRTKSALASQLRQTCIRGVRELCAGYAGEPR